MKNISIKSSIGLLILAAAIISLSGCAVKKASWGSLENGMIMKYAVQADRNLKYQTTYSFEQDMEVKGQKIQITAKGGQDLLMKPLESKGNDLEYLVTIEDMASKINTPRGVMMANLDKVIGQSFNYTVSPLGAELEYSGAEAITYDFGMGQLKSIASDVQAFFPDLPEHPVKPGDSWKSYDNITENTGSGKVTMAFTNINTFEKLEKYNGYDCMKINVVYTSTLEGEGSQNGADLFTTGTLKGTSTWYYAYKKGILVSYETDGNGETITEVKGPQEMTLPATRKYNTKSELVAAQ